jgi:hypothetical protein
MERAGRERAGLPSIVALTTMTTEGRERADEVLKDWPTEFCTVGHHCLRKIELLLFGFATFTPLRAPLRAG